MRTYLNSNRLFKHIWPKQLIWDLPNDDNIIYLTFDDGPTPGVTDVLLDELKKFNAKATFFCLGKNIVAHPSLFSQIKEEGHVIGNHTWDHLNGRKVNSANYIHSINKTQGVMQSEFFRPPYGRIKNEQAKLIAQNFKIIMWSVISGDFKLNQSKEECLNIVLRGVKSGSIVVFHDSLKASSKMLYAVPRMLEYFSEKGFKFAAISNELF